MDGQAIFRVIEGGRFAEGVSLAPAVTEMRLILRRPARRKRALLVAPVAALVLGILLIGPWSILAV